MNKELLQLKKKNLVVTLRIMRISQKIQCSAHKANLASGTCQALHTLRSCACWPLRKKDFFASRHF